MHCVYRANSFKYIFKMKKRIKLTRITYITGIVAFIIGAIDPLEGSILIALGSVLITLSFYLIQDRQRKLFMVQSISILFGIIFLFYFSSLGGFGGSSQLSWWWGLLILPYPIGWLIFIILLITRAVKKLKQKVT
jgi:hypothetical protein